MKDRKIEKDEKERGNKAEVIKGVSEKEKEGEGRKDDAKENKGGKRKARKEGEKGEEKDKR